MHSLTRAHTSPTPLSSARCSVRSFPSALASPPRSPPSPSWPPHSAPLVHASLSAAPLQLDGEDDVQAKPLQRAHAHDAPLVRHLGLGARRHARATHTRRAATRLRLPRLEQAVT
eukprot:3137416-Pleurochrysis_carterae.AAC.1